MIPLSSVVMGWLVLPDGVIGIDDKVGSINVVSFQYHLEHFWLMDASFFHEIDNFVLDGNRVINVIIELNLNLVFQLTRFA